MALKRSPEFCLRLTYICRKLTMSLVTLPRGHFGPRGIIYTNLLEVHKVMLHTKYQALGLMVSDKNFFYVSPHISLSKACDP